MDVSRLPRWALWPAVGVAALSAPAVVSAGALVLTILGGAQLQTYTAADLSGGAGSDFPSTQTFSSTFRLSVTTSNPCQVSVRRTTSSWLTVGDLLVQVKVGGSFAGGTLVDGADRVVIQSSSQLTGALFDLRYELQGATVRNLPGTYSAVVTYTVTES